mgnify:CR=1 FL=1
MTAVSDDTDYFLGALTEQEDGSYTIQLMEPNEDDPHGDGATLADEITVGDMIIDTKGEDEQQ